MKKYIIVCSAAIVLIAMAISFVYIKTGGNSSKLPAPEASGGLRGEFGIDKNINE